MVTTVRKFSVVFNTELCKVLFIVCNDREEVKFYVQQPNGERRWLEEKNVVRVQAEE